MPRLGDERDQEPGQFVGRLDALGMGFPIRSDPGSFRDAVIWITMDARPVLYLHRRNERLDSGGTGLPARAPASVTTPTLLFRRSEIVQLIAPLCSPVGSCTFLPLSFSASWD